MKPIYERYAKLRDEDGVLDSHVANETGVDQPTLIAWRNGDYSPKVDKIMKIAKYFGVSLDYFYNEGE